MMMRRKTDRLVAALTVICLLCLVVTIGVSATVLDTKSTTEQIQQERTENILRSCQDTNARYRKTVLELDRLYAVRTRGMTATQRAAVEASREGTLTIVSSMVPLRDCAAFVRQQVGS